MPETLNDDFHWSRRFDSLIHRRERTHWFLDNHWRVRIIDCSMVSVVFQPVARIFLVSRKMKGLSPTQPRLPPEYSKRGLTSRWAEMKRIELLTSTYSSVPRL